MWNEGVQCGTSLFPDLKDDRNSMSTPISIVWWRKIFVRYGQVIAVLMMITLVIGFGWNQFGSGRNNNVNSTAASPDKVVMKVNGLPVTQADYTQVVGRLRDAVPGQKYAAARGQAIDQLVLATLIKQMANQRNVKPAAAEIDKAVDQLKEQVGKNATDADVESFLQQRAGLTLAEYRDRLATSPGMLAPALLESYKAQQKVDDVELQNQNRQVKLDVVLIPTGKPMFAPPQKGQVPLTDAQARARADALLAQARKGSDIAALARANSADFSAKQGGLTEFRPEYRDTGGMAGMDMGSLGFGAAFDEAVHKAEPGKFTEVVKAGGFQTGYVFAKVMERKEDKPKDYDPRKAAEALKMQRAQKKVQDDLEARRKSAKVEMIDPDVKVYYDYANLMKIPQEIQMAQFNHTPNPPTQADFQKKQAEVDTELEALLKRHPDDATAALLVADAIKTRKQYAPGTTPAQREAYRDQMISLYLTALKSTEDRDVRFQLADLYAAKKDYPKAIEQYQKIAKYLKWSGESDSHGLMDQQQTYQRLQSGYTAAGQPQEADKMRQAATDLQPKIAMAQAQEAAQNKSQQAPGMSLAPGASKAGTLNLSGRPPGNGATGTASKGVPIPVAPGAKR